jgi:hypothetical protein
LRPYPSFTGFTARRNDGHTIYHSGQFRVEKRFSQGYTLLGSYTVGKMTQWGSFLNESDTEYEKRLSDGDRRHRWVASGILELPFGKQKRWGGNWNGFVDAILGGWSGTGMFQYQSGAALNFDENILLRGSVDDVAIPADQRTIDKWFNTSLFETNSTKQLANNIRTTPRQFPGVNAQPVHLWDLSVLKNFSIKETVRLQFRCEFLNAFNHAQFSDPERNPTNSNFGKITGQTNLARNIQFALKLIF